MNNLIEGWYLIYTKPRHEKKVFSRLSEMDINCFLPTRKLLRTWHDRRKYIDEPLFPSYVFVYLKDRQNYYQGIDTEGYLYYVRSGKEIARVNDSVVNNIMMVAGQADEIEISNNYFRPGLQLVISKGALTGLSCEVVEFNNQQKLLVRVDLLQRSLLITLPAEHLIAI